MLASYPLVTVIGFSAITCLNLAIFYFNERGRKTPPLQIVVDKFFVPVILLIFLFYFITALALGGQVDDVRLFATAGYALTHKIDIYWLDPQGGTYSFLPFLIYPYALFWYLSDKVPFLTFSFFVKLLLSPVIYLTSLVIAKQLIKQGLAKYRAKIIQLLFLVNPVVFLTVIFHGQADILLIFFYLLGLACLNLDKLIYSGFLMALSIATKSWSVIFLPLVILKLPKIRQKIIYSAVLFLTIIALVFLYKLFIFTSVSRIFSVLLNRPTGSSGYWGITSILNLLGLNNFNDFYSFYRSWFLMGGLSVIWILAWKKKLDLYFSSLLVVLVVYCLTAGWGLQHSLWLIPFGLINKEFKKTGFYTLLALPYLFLSYLAIAAGWQNANLEGIIRILGLIPWVFCLYWLWTTVKYFTGRKFGIVKQDNF